MMGIQFKLYIKYVLFFLIIVSCKKVITSTPKQEALINKSKRDSIVLDKKNIKKKEVISMDILSIKNATIGKSKFYFKNNLLPKLWGTPDSIKSFDVECGYLAEVTDKANMQYFEGISIITYNEEAKIEDVDFTITEKIVNFSEITLSKNSELADFKKFKGSYSKREEYITENSKNTTLRFLAGKNLDEFVILSFIDGKLVFLSVWEPC